MDSAADLLEAWMDKTVLFREPRSVTVEDFLCRVFATASEWEFQHELPAQLEDDVRRIGDYNTILETLSRCDETDPEMKIFQLDNPDIQEGLAKSKEALQSAYRILDHLLKEELIRPENEFVKYMQRGRYSIQALASRVPKLGDDEIGRMYA